MHQVLQRTRPSSSLNPRSSSRLKTLLRSFLAGKRGLVLLALVSGAALSSQALHGLLRPAVSPAPGTPAGGDGRDQSASTGEPAAPATAGSTTGSPSAAAQLGSRNAAPDRPVVSGAEPVGAPQQQRAPRQRGPLAALSIALRQGRGLPPSDAAPRSRRPLNWPRPSASHQGAASGPVVIAEPWSDTLPGSVPAAAPSVRGQDGIRRLGTVTLSDLDPALGVPCNDSTASLPSDRPAEEVWLPGSDASSANTAALDPIPVLPIYSESPDRAAGPSASALQATRNTPCLPKQPAGRN